MGTIFRTFLVSGFRDGYLLFWSIAFPIGLLLGLGYYFDSQGYREQLLVGTVSMSVLFGACITSAFFIMWHRNRGVYKLLRTTPVPTVQFVLAFSLARTVIMLLVSLVIWFTGAIVFGISLTWPAFLLVLTVLALGTLCFTCLSFFIANFARNEAQTSMISNLLSLPMVFTSEAFYSMQNAPQWIQVIGKLMPFSYFVEALRAAKQGEFMELFQPFLILLAFTVGILVVSVATFRWDPDFSYLRRPLRLRSDSR
jgi:ABC-2 type transport system permease protein